MKSWFNVSYVKLIICSQFRTPKCPICRVRVTRDKLLRLFINANNDEQADEITIDALQTQLHQKEASIENAKQQIKCLKRQNLQLRLVVNATCIYTTDVEENTLC